jgi:hypothetical protein
MQRIVLLCGAALIGALFAAGNVAAEATDELLETYAAQAKADDPAFTSFSAERGRVFYNEPHVVKGAGIWSCSSCHLKEPRYSVRAHRTDIPCRACHVFNDWEHPNPKDAKKRTIDPFAPSANAKRLNDPQRVETFLRLNCLLLLKRQCTALEKGDVIVWLRTVEGGPMGELINAKSRPIGGVGDD